ncbi:hypothetical protein SAMN05216278_3675 [Halopelagius longus]|uniref:Uncharacterized protein n=1 Tax=Halopelagius longus TaxID=1236180 RepID=A0A1H1GIE8_9EURY|nr:hypothetical protein SAMN05216278_3675 [Halopelagius longus]
MKRCNKLQRLFGIIRLAFLLLIDGTATNTVRRLRVRSLRGRRGFRWCGHAPVRDDHAGCLDDPVGRHRDDEQTHRRGTPQHAGPQWCPRSAGASSHPQHANVSHRIRASQIHRHRAARTTVESRHIPPQHPTDSFGAPPIAPFTLVGRADGERGHRPHDSPIRVPAPRCGRLRSLGGSSPPCHRPEVPHLGPNPCPSITGGQSHSFRRVSHPIDASLRSTIRSE